MSKRIEAIGAAYNIFKAAEDGLHMIVAKNLPPGTGVSWRRGGGTHCGNVITTSGIRVRVENYFTRRKYWIDIRALDNFGEK